MISPFLPNNEVATNYPGLKLMTQIEEADSYHSCAWRRDSTFLSTIFSRDVIACNFNRTDPLFVQTCVETNNIVTATATFRLPMQENDGGLYQVGCRLLDLNEVVVAQTNIIISGIHLNLSKVSGRSFEASIYLLFANAHLIV